MGIDVLKNLKPAEVFNYFEELSRIPRGSGNEKGVSDYLVTFAKKNNLEVIQDAALNIVIKKKASKGYENSPALILQGHMDIVCEKNADVEHDFMKDPLKLRVVDDMIYATGTTLGADNGIAVAMGMAVLASNKIEHPAIELLVTTSEETGMDGAMALDPKNVDGRVLINIDSEEEGKLLVSCAGGVTTKITIPVKLEATDGSLVTYAVKIRGLKGGHSGMEIDKGRANANKLLGRVLIDLTETVEFSLVSVNGGTKHNAIPREADAVIMIKAADKEALHNKVGEWDNIFKNEFRTPDKDVRVELEEVKAPAKVFSKETKKNVVNFLYLVSNGINSMSMDIAGLVESSQNLGVVTTDENEVVFITAIRSCVKSIKQELLNRVIGVANLTGGKVAKDPGYPEWAFNPNSKIRTVFEDMYEKMYGKKPEITAIHAGVECGLFEEKFGDIDMISFGPNMYDVHTPEEHLSISSVERSWNYLVEVLKNVK